jgi:uncharacterized protein YndB with AHSA1/START domain
MENQFLEIQAKIQIQKPVTVVFDAIVDPLKITKYFLSQSSGKLIEGHEVTWRFPEFDVDIPVRTGKIEKDRYISFYWYDDELELLVEISLSPAGTDETIVTVTEKKRPLDEAGIKWLKGNTEGWANFLACLKAYLEYGINLRKGGFDFMRTG